MTHLDSNDPEYLEQPSSSDRIQQFWRRNQEQLNQFWKIWSEDYLQSLRERRQNMLKQGRILSRATPVLGEVVLIGGEKLPRGSWKMGRIVELMKN